MDTGSVIDEAIASLNHARIVNYVNVASVALVSYDFLLTFADEVRLVWPSRWTVGKVMFVLTRYPVFLDSALNLVELVQPRLELSLCKPIYQAAAWMSFIGITIAELILMMRVYAIWEGRRDVLVFLIVLNLGVILPDIVLLNKSLRSLVFIPSPFPTLAPCVLIQADSSVYVDFILIMISEFVVIAMTSWKCYSHWRASKSTLMKTLLEDGLQYFVCMFAVSLANVLVVKTASVDYSGLLFDLQRILHAILSARIIMRVREAVKPEADSHAMSILSFAAAPGKKSGASHSDDSYNISSQDTTQFMLTTPSTSTAGAGPLSSIHITKGTLVDEDLYRAGFGGRDV